MISECFWIFDLITSLHVKSLHFTPLLCVWKKGTADILTGILYTSYRK